MATTPTAVDPRDTALTSPSAALAALLAGNARFAAGRPRHGHLRTPAGRSPVQHPFALVLACLDSRVTPEAVLDQDFGAVMAVRTGGHVLDDAVLGSVDFAVSVVGVPLLFVLAHRYCGGVAATVSAGRDGTRPDAMAPATVPRKNADHVERATRRHLERTVRRLADLPLVAERVRAGALAVAGGWYDVDTGRVEVPDTTKAPDSAGA